MIAFNSTVLLQGVGTTTIMYYTFIFEKIIQTLIENFSTIVGTNNFDAFGKMIFN